MCLGIPAQIKEIIDIDNQIAMVDLSGVSRAVNIETKIAKYSTQKGVEILPEVKNIIAVASLLLQRYRMLMVRFI
jgi:ferric iron reductase protein FhuF